jgi:hypothetical protein
MKSIEFVVEAQMPYSNPEFLKKEGLRVFGMFNTWYKATHGHDWPVTKDIPDALMDKFTDWKADNEVF